MDTFVAEFDEEMHGHKQGGDGVAGGGSDARGSWGQGQGGSQRWRSWAPSVSTEGEPTGQVAFRVGPHRLLSSQELRHMVGR